MNRDMLVVTHTPSGLQGSCLLSVHRSQHMCREEAMKLLLSRMWVANERFLSEQELVWDYVECSTENSQTKS